MAARLRSGLRSWRKIEETRSGNAGFLLKLLKSLALPRGIEPLFQPWEGDKKGRAEETRNTGFRSESLIGRGRFRK